jgi:hypothetical protein
MSGITHLGRAGRAALGLAAAAIILLGLVRVPGGPATGAAAAPPRGDFALDGFSGVWRPEAPQGCADVCGAAAVEPATTGK